jgi:hypothetical protein
MVGPDIAAGTAKEHTVVGMRSAGMGDFAPAVAMLAGRSTAGANHSTAAAMGVDGPTVEGMAVDRPTGEAAVTGAAGKAVCTWGLVSESRIHGSGFLPFG